MDPPQLHPDAIFDQVKVNLIAFLEAFIAVQNFLHGQHCKRSYVLHGFIRHTCVNQIQFHSYCFFSVLLIDESSTS